MSLERDLGRAWTNLQNADDSNRADRLRVIAELFLGLAHLGENQLASDRLTSDVLFLLADAEDTATGRIPARYMTFTGLEPSLGAVLNRMALTTDVTVRAAMLADLALLLDDDATVETLACMPFAGGRSGWGAEESWPSEPTVRGFVQALGVAWRSRRAA